MTMAMQLSGARGVVGIKEKYLDIIAAIEAQASAAFVCSRCPIAIRRRRVHPGAHGHWPRDSAGGLPKDVDCAVANVETLMNIGLDRP